MCKIADFIVILFFRVTSLILKYIFFDGRNVFVEQISYFDFLWLKNNKLRQKNYFKLIYLDKF